MLPAREPDGGVLTRSIAAAPPAIFIAYAVTASFSVYFCMYAFRKPFTAARFEGLTFLGTALELKTALVISQVIGYAISKYLGITVCTEATRRYRPALLVAAILLAQAALVLFAILPDQWKVVAIFFSGLPLGMVWGFVVSYLEGRRVSEILLAGLSCSFILASGVVKNVGQWLMSPEQGSFQIGEAWMPAATGALFLLPFLLSVWLLNQIPPPTAEDEALRTIREPMDDTHRIAFAKRFFWGLAMLAVAYVFLTAYRDYRDNYQADLFIEMGYQYDDVTHIVDGQKTIQKPGDKLIITRAETIVMLGVAVPLALLFLVRDNRLGLLATFALMTGGTLLLAACTWAYQVGRIDGFWWMTLTGLGAYLAYVPFGSVLFDRIIASTRVVGTAVFAIYIMDALGYTGSVAVQIYRDVIYKGSAASPSSRVDFFIDFSYFMAALGGVMLVASCCYFVLAHRHHKRGT